MDMPPSVSHERQTLTTSTDSQARQSPRPNRSMLLELPGEVLHLICAQLCHHCRSRTFRGSSELPMNTAEEWTSYCKGNSALHALSQACTTFRDAAQPLLYHFPRIQSHQRFLRTVRERPALADHVKHMWPVQMNLDEIAKDMSPDGFALVKKTAAELQMLVPGTEDTPFEDEFSALLPHLANKQDELTYECCFQKDVFQTLLQGMLIALLPCLEVMQINCWNEDNYFPPELYHHAKRRLRRTGRMISDRCDGNAMSSLSTVVVGKWRQHTYRWEREDLMPPGAPSGVFDGVHLDPHECLFTCASSLRQLIFRHLDAPYDWPATSMGPNPTKTLWSALPNLRSIEFEQMAWGACAGHPESGREAVPEEQQEAAYARIEQMARECASLRSFSISVVPFDGRGVNSFSPQRLLRSLMPAASRLEALWIQPYGVTLRPYPEILIGTDLHCFTRLQELSLLEDCFCHGWMLDNVDGAFPESLHSEDSDEEAAGSPDSLQVEGSSRRQVEEEQEEYNYACKSATCLVDIVPQSIISLTVRLRGSPRATPDIMHVGQAAAQGRFPSLRRVTVEFHEHIPGLEEAFRGSGVFVEVVSLFQ